MYHPFSIAETIKRSWHIVKANFISLIIYSFMSVVFYGIALIFLNLIFITESNISQIILALLTMLIESYLFLSFYKLILALMDSEYYEFEFKQIIPSFKTAVNFVAIGLLYTVLVVILFSINFIFRNHENIVNALFYPERIIVGYLLIRSIFCVCFIVDDESGPIESLKQSFYITRNNFFKTLAIMLIAIGFIAILLILINLLVTFCFDADNPSVGYIIKIAGIIWFSLAFPAVQVLIMMTYRNLVYSHQDLDDDVSETL